MGHGGHLFSERKTDPRGPRNAGEGAPREPGGGIARVLQPAPELQPCRREVDLLQGEQGEAVSPGGGGQRLLPLGPVIAVAELQARGPLQAARAALPDGGAEVEQLVVEGGGRALPLQFLVHPAAESGGDLDLLQEGPRAAGPRVQPDILPGESLVDRGGVFCGIG